MHEALAAFRDRHRGATAWLFGKGPSLDACLDEGHLEALRARGGQVLCAVNETVRDIAGAPYAFASDDCERWQMLYPAGVVLFQPVRVLRGRARPGCRVVHFEQRDAVDPVERLRLGPAGWLERGLAALPGTITAALQILAIMGIDRIVCVGIDGGHGRSRRPWLTAPPPPDIDSYDEIREAFICAAGVIGIALVFWSPARARSLA